MKMVEISNGVYSLRVNHFNRKLFDALIPLPDGTSYNSYLVIGTKYTVLLDTADPEKRDLFLDYLKEINKIDFVVAHHAEQDHSGLIPVVLDKYPQCKVLTNEKCADLLKTHLHIKDERIVLIKDGEKMDIGGKTLEFVFIPWVHWPETFATYLHEDRILFPCDFFGSHLATDEVYSTPEMVYEPMKRYYAEIMMPFSANIKSNLEKISKFEIKTICPSHGPIHNNVNFPIDCYKKWSFGELENKVSVLYVSMHNSTYMMVDRLISKLNDYGVMVEKLNLEDADLGRVAMSLVDSKTVVIATPTVLGGPHPKAIYAAYLFSLLRPRTKNLAVMFSYGWGGKTVEFLSGVLSNSKAELIGQVGIKGMPNDDAYKLIDTLAREISEKHLKVGAANK
ncbi:MAG TPA: FprA family A-type flavoprotein [Elusimicrobiales bacterium]|nr:FprA family A-type flavoprotein [Elusimicrobiales bacterium]HOL63256.1 FprA family A-type flavoprotein [Elusimicrobiales bacterium]HPO95720.1 FprA family A-type flavoprotein [Elusimicrobiales bacterium]